ncbi:hypothetical protein V8F20_002805 [Naviculisporaceae sp. PSN 640]
MFTVKSLLALAAVAVFSVDAAPAPASGNSDKAVIEARQTAAFVKICKDHYFGQCTILQAQLNTCGRAMPSGWNDVISSYEVGNRDKVWCRFYEHQECQGRYYDAQYDDTLHDGDGFWKDRISSLQCWLRDPLGCGAPVCP